MKLTLLTSLIATSLLIGCAQPKHIEVKVPIVYCPSPSIPEKPHLAVYDITENSSDQEVLNAYGQSLESSIEYSNTLTKILESYKGLDRDVNSIK